MNFELTKQQAAIQETARKQRIDDAARLENIKKEFLETYGGTRTK